MDYIKDYHVWTVGDNIEYHWHGGTYINRYENGVEVDGFSLQPDGGTPSTQQVSEAIHHNEIEA